MRLAATCLAILTLTLPAQAQTSFMLGLSIDGDAERKLVRYDCEGAESFDVEYINAAPNFLAFVPVDGQTYPMSAVIAGSGTRYAAATYVWWSKGTEAALYDATAGEDAAPILSCTEHIQTP
ncbi:MliC family protein [Devosia sp.]|jgi:membrane-bound inhibitor of C-type lysozyme|uniref:MliC family protein n=1 Tax=Devosia sp. TaxID=1871048 RepID=UPI0037BF4334